MLLFCDTGFDIDSPSGQGTLEGILAFAKIMRDEVNYYPIDTRDTPAIFADGRIDGAQVLDAYEHARVAFSNQKLVIATERDMTARLNGTYLNFCFGLGRDNSCIVSTYRLRGREISPAIARRANRLIAIHELGHVYGLVSEDAPRVERRDGIYTGHCTNMCVMRQVASVTEVVEHALALGDSSFCIDCYTDLTSHGL